jgi:2,3-bisphosphoglycerate-dependent phosphoglycerate mutase
LDDPRYPGDDPRYATLQPEDVPRSESLEDTMLRVAPYWKDSIAPRLDAGERVLIVAHGNSLRGLVKYLDGWGDEEIAALEIPTGVPLVYRLDARLRPLGHEYLGDTTTAHGAIAATAASADAP